MPLIKRKLGEVCVIKPPKNEARIKLNDDDLVSFVPMEDLGILSKSFSVNKQRKLSEVSGSYTYFANGDVLLAKITPCFENGKLGIARNLKNGIGFGSSEYIVFRPSEDLLSEYLFYFLSGDDFREEGRKTMSGAVGHKRVSKEFIEDYQLPLPPLPEQHRIVKILDEVFEATAKAKHIAEMNLQNSKDLFESYLQSVFANPGKDWKREKLGDLCTIITKGSSPKWQGINYVDKPGILFITSENIGENELKMIKMKYVDERFNIKDRKSILKFGDVLTNIVGASIGRTAIFNLEIPANINQAVCILRCNMTVLYNEYLANLLNSPFFRNILHSNEVNTARANLSLSFFSHLVIPLPPLPQQTSIVTKLDALSAETKKLEVIYKQKLADLEELKKSVLKKAFAGEL